MGKKVPRRPGRDPADDRSPTPDPRRYVPLHPFLEVPDSGSIFAVLLSDTLAYAELHYVAAKNQFVPCDGGRSCPWCHVLYPVHRYGYAAGLHCTLEADICTLGKPCLVTFTPKAIANCATLIRNNGDLRGQIYELFRFDGQGFSGAVRAEPVGWYEHPRRLRPAWDVAADLARRFGRVKADLTNGNAMYSEG